MPRKTKNSNKKPVQAHKRSASSSSTRSKSDTEKTTMTDEEIIRETYSPSEPEIVDTRHIEEKSRSLKRNRVSGVQDKDLNMLENNTLSNNSNNKETFQMPANNKEFNATLNTSLDKSIHNPGLNDKNSKGKEKEISRDTNKQLDHQDTQIKNNNDDQTKTPEDLTLNSEDEFKDYRGAESYDLFTLLTYAQSRNKDTTKENLKKIFNKLDNFIGVRGIYEQSFIHYAVIKLSSKIDQNSLDNVTKSQGNIKFKFHILNTENLNKEISHAFHERCTRTIKIVDIDSRLPNDSIIQSVTNIGQIESLQEIKKPNTPRSRDNNKRRSTSFFKQMYVVFKEQQAVNNIMNKKIYSIQIENTTARILPWDTNSQEFKERTAHSYKITGLPVDVTIWDLKPLIKKLNGWSCTIMPKYVPQQSTKVAYTYVSNENYMDVIKKFNIFGTKVFVIPNHIKRTCCTICGDPTHNFNNCQKCTQQENGFKYAPKVLIHTQNTYRPKYTYDKKVTSPNSMEIDKKNNQQEAMDKLISILRWSSNVSLETNKNKPKSISGRSTKSNNNQRNNNANSSSNYNQQLSQSDKNTIKELQQKILKLEQNVSELKKDNEKLNTTIHDLKTNFIPENLRTSVRLEINEIANELKPSQKPNKSRSFSFNDKPSSSIYEPYRGKYSNDADNDSISVSGQTDTETIKTAEIINPNNKYNTNNDEELGSVIDGTLPTTSFDNNNSINKRSLFNIFNY